MTESIFVRVQRVISASADGAVAAAERASGTSLMREAIRQVERAADEVRTEHDAARARRAQAEHQQKLLRERLATLDEQARFAIGKGREDLAEAAVGQQIVHEKELARLKKIAVEATDEAARLERCMADLRLRRSQMEKELAAFQAARAAPLGDAPIPTSDRAERKAERAKETFERALSAAGGLATGLADDDDAGKLAEVEKLQKEAAVAERLAALRAKQTSSPGAAKGRRKPRAS